MNEIGPDGVADENRRKRARFRSWHRGMREMDLILGPFADARIHALTGEDLEQYERLLDIPDADLLGWITGARPVPSDVEPIFFRVRDFAAPPHS